MDLSDIKERFNWTFQFSSILECEELTEAEKIHFTASFENLKKIFGENFLMELFNSRHPLVSTFFNHAGWTREWISWFSDSLYKLKDQHNFQSLIERLVIPSKYPEGLSVLETAAKFSNVNLFVDFDPKIVANNKEKMPDLYITSKETNENFYIEVSTLEQSQDLINNIALTSRLTMSAPVKYCGILHRNLSSEEHSTIVNKIQLSAEQAFKENKLVELQLRGIIEMAFAPIFSSGELEPWAESKGYRIGNLILPRDNFNPSLRLKRKVEAKQSQLPAGKPNILALKMKDVHSLWFDKSALISAVQEAVNKYDHLFAVIIFDQHWGSLQNELIIQDMNFFICKHKGRLIVENSFVFFNKFSKVQLTPNLLNDIFSALIHN
jgi:hypothetical protein